MKYIYALSLLIFLLACGCENDKEDSTIGPDLSDTLWTNVSDALWPNHGNDFRLICSPNDSVYFLSVCDDYVYLTALNKSYYYGLKGCCQYSDYAADFSPNGQFYYCNSISLIAVNGVEMYYQRNASLLSDGIDVMAFYGVNNFNCSHPDRYLYRLAGTRNCIAFASDGLPVVFISYCYNQTDSFKRKCLTALKFTGYYKWISKGTIDPNTNSEIMPSKTFLISDKKSFKISAVYTKVSNDQNTVEIVVKENNQDTFWTQLGKSIQIVNGNNVKGGYATDGKPVLIYGEKGSPGTVVRIRHWNGSSWENWGDQVFNSEMGCNLTAAYVDSKNRVWFAADYYENGDPYHTKIAILRRNSDGKWLNVSRGMVTSQNAKYSITGMIETSKGEFYISESISSTGSSQLFIYKWTSKKW